MTASTERNIFPYKVLDMGRNSTGGGRNSDIESEYDSEAIDDNVEEVRNDKIESDSEEDVWFDII